MLDVDARLDATEVAAAIERLLDAVADSDEFWDDLRSWWRARQEDWFASDDLPANAPATIGRKGANTPLVDTGQMRASTIENQPFRTGSGDATFGLRRGTPSYRKATLGLSGARGAPVRRAVPPVIAQDEQKVREILSEYLAAAADGRL